MHSHEDNKHGTLMWGLVKGDMGLGEGLGGANIFEAVEERIKVALSLGDDSL